MEADGLWPGGGGYDAGDVPQLVEDGKTGFVVRRGDMRH